MEEEFGALCMARRLSQIINVIVCDIAPMVASPTLRPYSNQF